jgi:hypothetical protein
VRRMNIALLIIALLALVGAGTGIGLATSAGASARAGATTAWNSTHPVTQTFAAPPLLG